ncbi:hypothetical protein MKK88_05925 [Methylobacterium sp. E-005]|uniref:hypothetical protein n=1 Tax=Methylobacterium sp. E-005 TaxID=2836549 RepID=UPI001FB92C6C|nr:hypothetical protein [Methylobacterium sp. E-005]MCJ2085533.1 hypothetical protein [Methylobacterium sp. E-005]
MAGYQTIEALRPILHRGPPVMPVVSRDLVRPQKLLSGLYRKNGVPDAIKARIAEMRREGASYRQIRIALGVSFCTAHRYGQHVLPKNGLMRSGWHNAATPRKPKGNAFAERLHRSGFSYREIADELGVCYSQAYYIINPRLGQRTKERQCKMLERVSVVSGIGAKDLRKDGTADYRGHGDRSKARHLLFWLLRRYRTELSLAAIGKRCGGFDRRTVQDGIKRADLAAQSLILPYDLPPLTAARRLWQVEWPKASA